eukprot:69791_1
MRSMSMNCMFLMNYSLPRSYRTEFKETYLPKLLSIDGLQFGVAYKFECIRDGSIESCIDYNCYALSNYQAMYTMILISKYTDDMHMNQCFECTPRLNVLGYLLDKSQFYEEFEHCEPCEAVERTFKRRLT